MHYPVSVSAYRKVGTDFYEWLEKLEDGLEVPLNLDIRCSEPMVNPNSVNYFDSISVYLDGSKQIEGKPEPINKGRDKVVYYF